MRKFLLFLFISLMTIGTCNAQIFYKNVSRKTEKGLFGKTRRKNNEIKVREPKKVTRAKKKQESNQRKLKNDYNKSVKRSQKRTIDIQPADVQARMKQDKKNSAIRDKAKKKKVKSATRNAGKKYK